MENLLAGYIDEVEIFNLLGHTAFGENSFEHLLVVHLYFDLFHTFANILVVIPNQNYSQTKIGGNLHHQSNLLILISEKPRKHVFLVRGLNFIVEEIHHI